MPFNTITVSGAVAPTVIETYISHYLNRSSLHQKPTAHVSYHEGLQLIRSFLTYASHHTVEELQAFTSQWVPTPRWVRTEDVIIPQEQIFEAASILQRQLGPHGIDRIGGKQWWQWRRNKSSLKGEWIEMRNDYTQRKKVGEAGKRVMLYIHGGAYFFGSVDEHRYQMQRHARKLKARVFAPRYRLAPQFPFPCGLLDCLSAYLYLLTIQDPSTIVLAGDSAGGGMIVSMLVILRDQGLPPPAGAVLISPWVDLTHSFPSVAGDSDLDYIPAHGFLHRPSSAWPPPTEDEMCEMLKGAIKETEEHLTQANRSHAPGTETADDAAVDMAHAYHHSDTDGREAIPQGLEGTIPSQGHNLSILLDGKQVEIKDQIQMYATNQLLSHPLVSPVLQASLGGLPPLLILTGGGEMLRDEQIYLAHKAANPQRYPPSQRILDLEPDAPEALSRWKGTDVQLQVWEDCCHVTPTLSFTRPAKYMYRSIAQFSAWALARAQEAEIEIMDDDQISVMSSDSDSDIEQDGDDQLAHSRQNGGTNTDKVKGTARVGRAGDTLPPFRDHMIRQRVDRHGVIYPLAPSVTLPALQMCPDEVGVIKPGPVRKWLTAKREWDRRYAREKRQVQRKRAKELAEGYEDFKYDDVPPPSALAARRQRHMPKEAKKNRSWGMSLWSLWGSSHDEKAIEREERADREPEVDLVTASKTQSGSADDRPKSQARSRSRRRPVTDEGQTRHPFNLDELDENSTVAEMLARRDAHTQESNVIGSDSPPTSSGLFKERSPHTASERPFAGGVAFPFKLALPEGQAANASMLTLESAQGALRNGSIASHAVATPANGTANDGANRIRNAGNGDTKIGDA